MFFSVRNIALKFKLCAMWILTHCVFGTSLGVRHVQAFLLFFGIVIFYSMRINMSMAIVSMTEESFDWSPQTQGVILSSFFWGYVLLQIPAGILAGKYGGKILITLAMIVNSGICWLLPSAAFYGGWHFVCACRVIQGLFQGVLYPSIHTIIGKWAPLEEKSRFGTFVFCAAHFGTAIQYILSGVIGSSWGWPSIFYVNGLCGVIWTFSYISLGAKDPQSSHLISEEEEHLIATSLGQTISSKNLVTPWRSIWTSLPFWALLLAHCGNNWGHWTLLTEMPTYFSKVLGVDIKSNGIISALPYFAMFAVSFPFGFMADYSIKQRWFSTTTARKISNTIGFVGPAIALIGLSHAPAGSVVAATVLLTLTVALNVGHITGFSLVHTDMSPNFAGVLMGLTNCASNILSIIAPLVAGALIKDDKHQSDWRKVFYVSSIIYFLSAVIFDMFASCELQDWNNPVSPESNYTDVEEEAEKGSKKS